MHLQFKFTFSRKIQVNIKNLKNIPKSHRKVPNWNMCFKVLYKCHRKNLKTKKKYFAECRNWHSAKEPLCRVPGLQHSAKTARLPSGNGQHSAKGDGGATGIARGILPRVILCRVPDTRQRGCLPSVSLCRVFTTTEWPCCPGR